MDGIVLIHKPIGISSFHALSQVKRYYATKKVGHTGTLDPFAEGLLVVCINQATKIASYIETEEKEYIATLKLGIKTDSGDNQGNVIEEKMIPDFNLQRVQEVLASFVGNQKQLPPMYSALKINGRKLYDLARQGLSVERTERDIEIKSISTLNILPDQIIFKVVCSKGTYIRTLGEDIALKLGTVGHLIALKRTRIGDLRLENAVLVENLNNQSLIPLVHSLPKIPKYLINQEQIAKIYNGNTLKLDSIDDIILLVNHENEALALYQRKDDEYICVRGLWR